MRLFNTLGDPFTERRLRHALRIPVDVAFQPGFRCMAGNLQFSGPCSLGDTLFVDYAPIQIGRNVGFSFQNILVTSTHSEEDFNTIVARPIVIEDNVWITSGVTVLGGVTIGTNSIIGAGSIVTRDIPRDSFAAGNPCKVIRPVNRNS